MSASIGRYRSAILALALSLISSLAWADGRKLVFIVMDGPRYTETFASQDRATLIPNLVRISTRGTLFEAVYNLGKTSTIPGHTALSTGVYEDLPNDGTVLPSNPGWMEQYLAAHGNDRKVWLVTSKDKLEILAGYAGKKNIVRSSSGNSGINTGYRADEDTLAKALEVLERDTPDVLFINFQNPDSAGHAGDWQGYLAAISRTDTLIGRLYDYLEADSDYRGQTTFIVASDHGRHSDGIYDGFKNHWCDCDGCRHLILLACGPDTAAGAVVTRRYEQIDIAVSVAKLLGVALPASKGIAIAEIVRP